MNILLVFYPSLYVSILFHSFILSNHNSKIIDELNFIATNETETIEQYKKGDWLKLIHPVNILGTILGSIRSGGTLGCIGSLVVFIPVIIFIIIYPIASLSYFLYINYSFVYSDLKLFAVGNIIFCIWSLIAMIIYVKSSK